MAKPAEPIRVDMYSRPRCHLCDDAHEVIERVRRRHDFAFRIINIEEEASLEAAYGTEIPVIFINGEKAFMYRVDEKEFERKLKRWSKT